MKFLTVLAAALAFALPAQAQIYKCTANGKVTYSEAPCQRGKQVVLATPDAPAPDPDRPRELARQRAESERLQRERETREAAQERADQRADRAAAARRQRCDKAKLERRLAEEDIRNASPRQLEAARARARRVAALMALECPL
ncbi:DUF4124 domain-containing protein [Massilia sp. YMA4]|uniref:DUF4124 domain-containing protein n=1 Tax=[Empedobacter] haloabium TaxID=592317 RepID=A0ABZ1UVF6_9BURK|nr:DUF4124 domain-containing protein [Massilia sp. YMA4]AXA90961.1 DUF4124 domain-containing protein [Massilia sp. YMA4]